MLQILKLPGELRPELVARYRAARAAWGDPMIRGAAEILGMSEREYCDKYIQSNYPPIGWTTASLDDSETYWTTDDAFREAASPEPRDGRDVRCRPTQGAIGVVTESAIRQAVGIVLWNSFYTPSAVLVRERDQFVWKLPGGQIEPFENDDIALAREMSEELPNCAYGATEFLGNIVGISPSRGDTVSVAVYAAVLPVGQKIDLTVAHELVEAQLFPLRDALDLTGGVTYRALKLFDVWWSRNVYRLRSP